MKRYLSYDELETLCEAMIRDYHKSRNFTNILCVDIEGFVTEYLGVKVIYETFAEEDVGKIGFLSDGVSPLWVRRNGRRSKVVYPENTAVIERSLLSPKENARRRFTVSHEGAHQMLKRHAPIEKLPAAAFHSEFDRENTYSPKTLREMLTVEECLANRAAACFLMPRGLVTQVLNQLTGSNRIPIYEGGILPLEGKLAIQKMADTMGVSFSAFFNRLRELDFFDVRPIEEYLHDTLKYGGT